MACFMLTGFGSEEIAVQSIHEGAIDYIPKDHLTKENLLNTIKLALETWKRKRTEEEKGRLVEELEAKNEELERFTYSVSHDLKSPLSAIYGYASILREDLERNEIEKGKIHLKRIENAVTLMDKMLSDTLQLSRVGRVVNPPEDVPFGELIEKALEQTEEKIKSRKININYMGEQPHPKIEIGHRLEGEETVFFVRDNGIGIEPSKHAKVFELFYRIDRSSKGTGAGLAIVRRKIEVHGGRIWIESEKGKGCTVCFTLPVV
jgi:signal transduction histidine kinase